MAQWVTPQKTYTSRPVNSVRQPVKAQDLTEEKDVYPNNTSPRGRNIVTGIGYMRVKAEIIWWSGFNGSPITNLLFCLADLRLSSSAKLYAIRFNDEYVYRASSPKVDIINQYAESWEFYDGTQTAAPTAFANAVGSTNANAYTGFTLLSIDNLDVTAEGKWGNKVPIVECEIFTDATEGAVVSGVFDRLYGETTFSDIESGDGQNAVGWHWDMDRLYIVTCQNEQPNVFFNLAAHSISQRKELWRVNLSGPPSGVPQATLYSIDYFIPLGLSDKAIIWWQSDDPSFLSQATLMNVKTGELLAEWPVNTGGFPNFTPHSAQELPGSNGEKFVVVGRQEDNIATSFNNTNDMGGYIVDITNDTYTAIIQADGENGGGTAGARAMTYCHGAKGADYVTFYICEESKSGSGNGIWKVTIKEDEVNWLRLLDSPFSGDVPLFFNPLNGALVYTYSGSPNVYQYLNGVVTLLSDSNSATIVFQNMIDQPSFRAISSYGNGGKVNPGYGLGMSFNDIPILINLTTGSADYIPYYSEFQSAGASWTTPFRGYDQTTQTYYENDYSENQLNAIAFYTVGDLTPGTINLQDVFTSLATMDGIWEAGDLSFTGFAGGELDGFMIDSDTSVQDIEATLAEMFDVKITQSDGVRKYRKMPTDGSFAVDFTLTDGDIVER